MYNKLLSESMQHSKSCAESHFYVAIKLTFYYKIMYNFILDIREQLLLIEKSVNIREHRHSLRVIRVLPSTRRKLNNNVFMQLCKLFYNGRQSTDEEKRQQIKTDLKLV